MEVQPPWKDELLARNRKVALNMWSSVNSYLKDKRMDGGNDIRLNCSSRCPPLDSARVQDSSSPTSTERSNSIDKDDEYKEFNRKDESIVEYGPGIVKKLKSKYQSLALRNTYENGGSKLWRSTSLEDYLESISNSSEDKLAYDMRELGSSPSPQVSKECSPVREKLQGLANLRGPPPVWSTTTRSRIHNVIGRAGSPFQDRMRRARSVDALHSPGTRSQHEEDIIEKLKTIVLPKEDIVIIEVPKKPQDINKYPLRSTELRTTRHYQQQHHNGNSAKLYSAPAGLPHKNNKIRQVDKSQNCITQGYQHSNPGLLGDEKSNATSGSKKCNSVNSGLASCGNVNLQISDQSCELPPPDIVKETARIFEKSQESVGGNTESGRKLIGNVRLNKSLSRESSPVSPTSAKSGPFSIITTKGPSYGAEPTHLNGVNKSLMNGSAKNLQKQVGVIKPRISKQVGGGDIGNDKGTSVIENGNAYPAISEQRSPATSPPPVTSTVAYKNVFGNPKPPLSPKPVLPSAPKLKPTAPVTKAIVGKQGNRALVKSPPPPESFTIERESEPEVALKRIRIEPKMKTDVMQKFAQPETVAERVKSPEPFGKNKFLLKKQSGAVEDDSSNSSTANVKTVTKSGYSTNEKELKNGVVGSVLTSSVGKNRGTKEEESLLRNHQKKKSNMNGSTMVFNFTGRKQVPDYIEDDGLHNMKLNLSGTVSDESSDFVGMDEVDCFRVYDFEGANVIINGKSSLQVRKKSKKLNISFNEEATVTYEYPSELAEQEESRLENGIGNPKSINAVSNAGVLGSYVPKKANSSYQLGNYNDKSQDPRRVQSELQEEGAIEEYLKPDTVSTTWSNEITSDILF